MADCSGYDDENILIKPRDALLKVKKGEAVYERDSVLFDSIQYSWPLLAGLMWVAARSGGSLNVLDFGGSLGSTYFQNRDFLSSLPSLRWNVVEQSKHVEVGRALFQDDRLRFYPDVESCMDATEPNVSILSSVLQYLEHPYDVLEKILQHSKCPIIIDRTPFWEGTRDMLSIQTVPPSIYKASYPSWIFSKEKFFDFITKNWTILTSFKCPDKMPGPVKFSYEGMIFVRNS